MPQFFRITILPRRSTAAEQLHLDQVEGIDEAILRTRIDSFNHGVASSNSFRCVSAQHGAQVVSVLLCDHGTDRLQVFPVPGQTRILVAISKSDFAKANSALSMSAAKERPVAGTSLAAPSDLSDSSIASGKGCPQFRTKLGIEAP